MIPDSQSSRIGAPFDEAILLVNSRSRRGKEEFEEARLHLIGQGVRIRSALHTRHVSKLIKEAEAAIAQRQPLIIVGGGDGTMNAVAGLFVGSKSTMGVLPMGTGNAFARDLGIATKIASACEIAIAGAPTNVDIGRAGDGYFVNVATVGLTTKIAENLTDPMKRRFGRLVYAIALVRAYREIRPFHTILKTENGTQEFESIQIVIGNGRFHAGPFPVLPDASILEGKLSLYAIESRTKSELLKFALFMSGGRHVQLNEVHSEHCLGGTLTTRPQIPVTVDGQIAQTTPLVFSTVPRGLRVMAAPGFFPATTQPK